MLRPWCFLLVLASLAVSSAHPLQAQECPRPTAVVLSGGGAKGLAHIGVLRVLDSLGVRPDLIVGTSMGAIVGALYASGYSGRELDSLARVLPLSELFRAYEPQAPRSLGILQPLVVWEQGERRFNLKSASIIEAEVNALVNAAMLKGNLLARGNFDSLVVPFRAVATDLADREIVVLSSGDLAQAVRASAAVPLVFAPERVDGKVLIDGGLSANIPVRIARKEGARTVIVSDATEHPTDSIDVDDPLIVADRLVGFLFDQPADSLRGDDRLIRPDIDGFKSLDFSQRKVVDILDRGRRAADTSLARLNCRPAESAAPGGAARDTSLPRRVTGVTISDANDSERLALELLLGLGLSDTLDVDLLRSRLRHLGLASEAYRSVWLRPTGAGDSVEFDLALRRAARRVAGLGLAYDNELGGQIWIGLVDRRFLGLALEGSGALFVDELRQELYAGLRRTYQVGRQLFNPTLTARLVLEDVRQFQDDGEELPSAETREAVGFAGAERGLPNGWELAAGIVGHAWREPDRKLSTLGVVARMTRASRSRGRVALAELIFTGVYSRIALEGAFVGKMGPLRVIPRFRLGWGEDLPLQATFPLGGYEGFPGLHIGERRGDRELMAGARLAFPIKRPLQGSVELATGRNAFGGGLLDDDGWVGGARVGIGAETPVGPVRLEYGYSTEERGAVVVRLGVWYEP